MNGSDHYFSEQPDVESSPFDIEVTVGDRCLKLRSDRGVFSAVKADRGSVTLAETMEVPKTGEILDLGCGYGLLGIIAALRAPEAQVTFVDINRRAVRLAKFNCRRFGLEKVTFIAGDAPEVLGDRRFDAILCNPPYRAGKDTVMRLIEDGAGRLREGGRMWIVGRTKQGIKTLKRDISAWFDETETVEISGGYRVVRCDGSAR